MRSASQPPRWRFIFKLVPRLAPSHLLELGTHVGLGAAYMAAALTLRGSGRLVTLEGSPALADIARRNLVELGLATRVDVRTGLFTATLPHALKEGGYDIVYVDGHHDRDATIRYHEQILPHVRSIALYDDVTYSDGMREAWAHIQSDSRFAVSLTCPPLGVGCLGSRRNLHVHSWLPIQAI